MIPRIGRRSRRSRGRDREHGQILVLFTLVLVGILGFTALVVDLGLLRNDRQSLANAMDAGALAGGTLLPVDGSQDGQADAMQAIIERTVGNTYPGLSLDDQYQITYRCLIGTGAGDPGAFDAEDVNVFVPLDCDPSHALGLLPANQPIDPLNPPPLPAMSDFTGAGKTRSSDCQPAIGDRCNVVVVDGAVTTPFSFGRVVGVNSGNTGVVTSSACRGLCGELPRDNFDVTLIVDTSGSMVRASNNTAGHTRLYWAQQAAHQLLTSLENARGIQQVGLVRFSGDIDDPLAAEDLAPLSTDLGLVGNKIDGLVGAGNTPTRLGIELGRQNLAAGARPGAAHIVILLSDGRPWPADAPTRPTVDDIAALKGVADQVFTVLIGEGGGTGADAIDPALMRSIAKPDDDTHVLRAVDASDLPDIFRQIAVDILAPRSHLIQVYPAPIVNAVGGVGSVSISGKYFTGANRVSFGGANVDFVVNSDTSITADAPSRNRGSTVTVHVVTGGGASAPGAPGADRYTFP